MIVWEDPKNPGEVKDYRFDWSRDLGDDVIASATAVFVAGSSGGMTIGAVTPEGHFTVVWLSGGTEGQTALILGRAITAGGRTFEEVAQLRVLDPSDTTTATLDSLIKDRAAVYAARLQFITGGQIKEVWRERRRLTYNVASLADYDSALLRLDSQIAELTAQQAGVPTRRFRALRPRFNHGTIVGNFYGY